ncbi:hypothetical protein C9374_000376, partial [Naegleria lovaniensis]
ENGYEDEQEHNQTEEPLDDAHEHIHQEEDEIKAPTEEGQVGDEEPPIPMQNDISEQELEAVENSTQDEE